MRKEIIEKIEIPEGIDVEISGDEIKIRKNGKEIARKYSGFKIKKTGNELVLEEKKATKKVKKLIKTTKAHINNMLSGFGKKYVYKLQICTVHFPMNVSIKGNELIIKNFLGEVKERKAKILDGVDVKVEKEIITVESSDKEKAGQTAANMEKATRIRNRDRRVFQDGIFITEKQKGARR